LKALTIHQPKASLIVYGQKRVELRTWRTLHRGPIAIHASGRLVRGLSIAESYALAEAGLEADDLALGALVGTVVVRDCLPVSEIGKTALGELERGLGDFTLDRYGWLLDAPVAFTEPVPALGARNLWDVDDELVKQGIK
jgi:hypothetical protein